MVGAGSKSASVGANSKTSLLIWASGQTARASTAIPTITATTNPETGGVTNYAGYEMSDGSIKTINYRDLDDVKGGN
jgi:hypothetical protein